MDNQTASKILELMAIDLTGLLAGISKRNPLDDVVKQRIEAINVAQKVISDADVSSVRHGHWIHCAGKSNLWYCSECGGKIIYNQKRGTYIVEKKPVNEINRFCRSCGAKMDGGEPT